MVCYWNGFGIGSDADQRRLLKRIATTWLTPDGCLLMNVFSAWWWARKAGQEEFKSPNLTQGYDFDPVGCRFIDKWWRMDDKSLAIAQYIRCYTPVDLLLLLEVQG